MGWRTKFVFLLMVYVAGFLTAVYFMTPTQEGFKFSSDKKSALRHTVQSNEFAQSVNTGLSKCAVMGKTLAGHASALIKQHLSERRKNNSSKRKS